MTCCTLSAFASRKIVLFEHQFFEIGCVAYFFVAKFFGDGLLQTDVFIFCRVEGLSFLNQILSLLFLLTE